MSSRVTAKAPANWSPLTLGELTDPAVEQTKPNGVGEFVYVDISSIDREIKRIVSPKMLPKSEAPSRARQLLRAGDVLVSMTRPNLNAVALVPPELDRSIGSTGFHVLRPKGADPRWLFYAVQTNTFINTMTEIVQGVLYPAVRPKGVRAFSLFVPPSEEQHRIVEEIEKQLTRLDAGVAALKSMKANLKRYRAAVLRAACEGRLVPTEAELARREGRSYESGETLRWRLSAGGARPDGRVGRYDRSAPDLSSCPQLPKGWAWASIDLVGDLLLGRQRAPQYLTGRYSRPYLRVANVKDDRIDLSDVAVMDFDEKHLEKYRLQPGDILLSEGQSTELVGQSAIYRGDIDGLCFQKTLHRYRSYDGGPSREFAQVVFRSHVRTGVFRRFASITTNIAHLTLEKLRTVPFPLPPLAEQERIVTEVERCLSLADALERLVCANLHRAARLRMSILDAQFSPPQGGASTSRLGRETG